ncbi:hypothetical protein BIV57_10185 [Mangrovactinospora gilvigrisea]|uniref:Glycerophosphoryl diester phosphodiesterase membrane domain-containing protein n=1 Tax=Mangrovactinospora gilvigrisea TaxID=1428644 RepID=A0A1J7BFY8_9ACTN|nr:hypothetical protein [Mangrovactinospora gilvigrisea]OIV37566.1 hypothetical protein BIV57_10185 [Mangrovactinospora gilvigrisea]
MSWSPQQPPPSPWLTPPGGGQGGRWFDAPKPGVIPLRPLRMGELFEAAVSTIRLYWRSVLGFTLPVAVIVQAAVAAVGWSTEHDVNTVYNRFKHLSETTPPPPVHDIVAALKDALPTLLLNLGLAQLLSFLGMLLVTAVCTLVIGRAVTGAPLTPRQAFRDAGPRLPRLAGLSLLVTLIPLAALAVGLLPTVLTAALGAPAAVSGILVLLVFAGAAAALFLGIRLTLAGPALMLEKQGIGHALSRAMRLAKGSWWRILGIQLVVALITLIVTTVISMPFNTLGNMLFSAHAASGSATSLGYYVVTGIGGVVGTLLVYPFSACVTALLYVDLRIRREGLDLDLAKAAGINLAP